MTILRRAMTLFLVAITSAAAAAEWTHYTNVRFAYAIDVPPGFVGKGEPDNSDGQTFRTPTAELSAFAGYVDGSFEDQAYAVQQQMQKDGIALTYEAQTPNAASFSGKKGGKIVYVRLISLCNGAAYGEFWLSYGRADAVTYDPIVSQLVRSFKPLEGGVC